MFAAIAPSSPVALAVLIFCFVLVLAFEFSNGFHDTANAVATVIYTHSLKPVPAVVLSGTLNFLGVVLGGVAVAFTLVELLPPDVLTPPNGNPAIAMLLSLFLAALIWNVATWWLGIPCSSSHAIIGSLLGVGTDELDHRRARAGPGRGLVAGLVGAARAVRLAADGLLPGRRAVPHPAGGDPRRHPVRADRGTAAAAGGCGAC